LRSFNTCIQSTFSGLEKLYGSSVNLPRYHPYRTDDYEPVILTPHTNRYKITIFTDTRTSTSNSMHNSNIDRHAQATRKSECGYLRTVIKKYRNHTMFSTKLVSKVIKLFGRCTHHGLCFHITQNRRKDSSSFAHCLYLFWCFEFYHCIEPTITACTCSMVCSA